MQSIERPRRVQRRLKRLCDALEPASFSEHLAWSTHELGYLSELLPLPYTEETLERVARHVGEAQEAVGMRLLLENPSTYLLFEESTIEETEFLARVAMRSGCGLLLDVNNVMVSAVNHRLDPIAYVDRFPVELVGEIHLAGYDEATDGAGDRLLIDAHGSRVKPDVVQLYCHTLNRTGPIATLIEWDNDVPSFAVLLDEASRADAMLDTERQRRNRSEQQAA